MMLNLNGIVFGDTNLIFTLETYIYWMYSSVFHTVQRLSPYRYMTIAHCIAGSLGAKTASPIT